MKRSLRKNEITDRKLSFETLEDRHLLSATIAEGEWYATISSDFDVSADDQELLEWINQMRNDSEITLDRILRSGQEIFTAYDSCVTAAWDNQYGAGNKEKYQSFKNDWNGLEKGLAPLAFSEYLYDIASAHTQDMKEKGQYEHTDPNKLKEYFTENSSYGENVFGYEYPSRVPYSRLNADNEAVTIRLTLASFFHSAFAVDWGNDDTNFQHRANMMSSSYTEVGLSIYNSDSTASKSFVTEEFGGGDIAATGGSWLLGAIYDDSNNSGYYDSGEGCSGGTNGIRVTVTKLDNNGGETGDSVTINPFSSGGYQILLKAGTYSVTVSGGNFGNSAKKIVTIGGNNVKLDFVKGENVADAELMPRVDADSLTEGNDAEVTYSEKAKTVSGNVNENSFIYIAQNLDISNSSAVYAAKVTLTVPQKSTDSESLQIGTVPGLISNYDTQARSYYITGQGTLSDYEALLQSLMYCNYSTESSDYSDRTVSISVYNGYQWSNSALITVHVDPNPVTLTIESQKLYEGDAGMTDMVFTAVLSEVQKKDIVFKYEIGSSAMAGEDYGYEYSIGYVTIAAGKRSGTFTASIYGNRANQKNSAGETLSLYDENFDIDFDVTISEIRGGAELALDPETGITAAITGTVLDDDTPLAHYSGSSQQEVSALISDGSFITENGTRRFVYSFTANEDGLVLWNVDADALNGCRLSVYQNAVSGTLISSAFVKTSQNQTNRQTIQWSAVSGSVYVVMIEKNDATAISGLSASMLKINTNNMVMLEPLMEEMKDGDEMLFKFDGNDISLALGNDRWSFDGGTMFGFNDGSGFSIDYPYDSFSTLSAQGIESKKLRLVKEEGNFTIIGSNSEESVLFYGTSGEDSLVYGSGTGTFTTNIGSDYERTWNFTDLAAVVFNAYSGQNDTAALVDSRGNDAIKIVEDNVSISGGGYRLEAINFNKVECRCESGGNNSVYLNNKTEDISAWLAAANLIVSGKLPQNSLSQTEQEPESFVYNVNYFDSASINPWVALNQLTIVAASTAETNYTANFGWVQYNNTFTGLNVNAQNINNIEFFGFSESEDSQFTLLANNENYQSQIIDETSAKIVENSSSRTITLPKAFVASKSSASLSTDHADLKTAEPIELKEKETDDLVPSASQGLEEIAALEIPLFLFDKNTAAILDLCEEEKNDQDKIFDSQIQTEENNDYLLILNQLESESFHKKISSLL